MEGEFPFWRVSTDVLRAYVDSKLDITDPRFVSDTGMTLLHNFVRIEDALSDDDSDDDNGDEEEEEVVVVQEEQEEQEERDDDDFRQIVELLLQQGIAINSQTKNGLTPLHFLMLSGGDDKLVDCLCELHADPRITDSLGRTPLHSLFFGAETCCGDTIFGKKLRADSENKLRSTVTILKRHWLDINAQDVFGATALHYAALGKMSFPETVSVLLDNGADVLIKDRTGVCGLHLAITRSSSKTADESTFLEIMLKHVRTDSVNIADNFGATSLHFAAVMNDIEAAKMLVKIGADDTIKDAQGHTAGEVAKDKLYTGFLATINTSSLEHNLPHDKWLMSSSCMEL